MAVEIPVVIDIEGAFKDAANRVDSAVKPLQKQISAKTLRLDAAIGVDKKGNTVVKSFGKLLKESTSNANELNDALAEVNSRILQMQRAGGFNPAKGLKDSEREMLALKAALEAKLENGNFIDQATEKVKKLALSSKETGETAKRSVNSVNAGLKSQDGILSMLMRRITAYGALFAGIRLIRNIRNVTAEFEMQRVALAGIMQDTTKANQLFAEIKAAAVQSPFEIKDLVSFTKQLSAYRIETDKLFKVTMQLADVSAGLGVDMNRLVLAYGQVRAASVLRGQELRQFTEAGIPLVDLLAKKFTQLRGEMVSTGEVFELISERAVPFAMIEDIFNDMTSAGGIFYEMQLKQSETLKGQWMKLKDVISIAYDEMGRSAVVSWGMETWIKLISELVKNWERIASVVNVAVYSYIAYKAAVKGLIPFYNMQQKSIARQIQLEKQSKIEQIRLESTAKKLTAAEKQRIAVIKQMTAEDYKRIFAMDKMSQSQAMMTLWRNKDNKEIVKAVQQTGLLSKTQMNAVQKMNWMQIRLKTWGSSIRTFFANIGASIKAFWPIAVISALVTTITSLIQTTAEQAEAVKRVDKAYHEQQQSLLAIENAYKRIQQAIAGVANEQERAAQEAASFGQKLSYAQKVIEMLKKYGLGGDFDLSLLNTENIDDFVERWLAQLNAANELTLDWGRAVAQVANSWEASILGIHLAGDNLNTDIKDLTNAFVKLTSNKDYRQNVEDMRNYIESLSINHKKEYDILSKVIGEEAELAIAQKRRNETEYQYQMRLVKNYETIRKFAASDEFILSGAFKYFINMDNALNNFQAQLNEVEQEFDKTWGSMKDKDEITIKMAIDKLFAENQWEDWLKEAWIERVNQKYQMNIQVVPTVSQVSVPKGMKGIIATELEGLFTEQELENMNTVTEIGKAIDEKMKKASDAIAEVDRLANNFANNDAWSVKTQEKIKKAQVAIDTEMAKADKDRNQEAINEALAQIDALTKQNGLYEEQILKKKESAKAEYELAKAAKARLLNENLSELGKDIKQAFPDLMERNRIIDQMDLKSIGDEMKKAFPDASADLLARPLVDAAELVKKGWEEAGEGIATVYSSTFEFTDEQGKTHNLLMTPILPDGTILSPEELEAYVNKILQSTDLKAADTSKLILGVDISEDAGERLHEMQEAYYSLADKMKNVSNRFLISEDELKKVRDGADAYDLWFKNVKAIADEREKLAGAGVTEQTVAEEQARLDAERLVLQQQLESVEGKIAEHNYEEVIAKYNSLKMAAQTATTAEARRKAEAELQDFLQKTNINEGAALLIEKQRLVANLGIANAALGAQQAIANTFKAMDDAGKFWEEFGKRYNFTLKDKPKGTAGQDPWILLFKNRMKFMQDFQKGVEDLDKYMAHSKALGREQEIMKGRGLSIGIKTEELLGSPDELRNWYDKAIKDVAAKIRSMGGKEFASLGITEILAKDLTGRKIQKYQELLAELWKSFTDFDTNQIKKEFEEKFKKISEELKRSETARNFYQNILDTTGDQELAASMTVSVYGGIGQDFKERMQSELNEALKDVKAEDLTDELKKAVSSMNFSAILENLSKFPKEWQKRLKEMAASDQKYNAERVSTWFKELAKTKYYAEKRVEIELKTAQRLREIEESNLPDSQKKSLRAQYNEKKAKDLAKIEYEAFRDSPLYTEMFADLDAVSTQTLQRMRDELVRLQDEWKDLDPTQLKEIQSRLEAIDKVAVTRNPFGTLAKGFKELIKAGFGKSSQLDKDAADAAERVTRAKKSQAYALEVYTKAQDEYNKIVAKSGSTSPEAKAAKQRLDAAKMQLDVQTRALKVAQENADEAEKQKKAYADILRAIANSVEGLQKFNEKMQTAVAGAISLMEALGASEESIGMIQTMASGLDSVTSGIAGFASGFSNIISGKDIFGGITSLVGGVGGLFKGITNIFYAGRVKRANKKIKKQEKILISLQEAYKDLDRAIAKAFGNEYIYNYNQQLKNLQAQAAAYQNQADAERSKGKKKDKSKIESYEQSYRDTMNEIKDMQYQMAEYFAGTDITSAAEAFADAWLEAYKEFGNTTDAIKEKMQDMVESIVKRAALAGVVQAVLQPWYNELAQIEQWDPGTVAAMINKAYELVPTITAGLGSEAAALQAAGVNLRDTVGDFKGISRDIAGASEESILALAAGINTQNFYMSYMPIINENVAAIRAALTGEAVGAQAPSLVQSNNDLVLQYMSVLPNMDANIAELLSIARKVVEPRGTNSSSHVVAVRM